MAETRPSELMLRQRLAVLARALPPARGGDAAAIHQARVATRRLRAALPLVARGAKGRKLSKAACRLTRALGSVRELDVALQTLDELERDVPAGVAGIELLRAAIDEERQRVFADMIRRIGRVDLDRLQRKALAAARRGQAEGRAHARLPAVARRAARRARSLRAAMDNAGGIYLPDRLHQVRIAVKKLRYTLEIARELSRSRASSRIRRLKTVQDLLGRMHDLEVLIMRIRALQGSERAPSLSVSADLDRLVRTLETECRQLHVRYMELTRTLHELCDDVATAGEGRASAA